MITETASEGVLVMIGINKEDITRRSQGLIPGHVQGLARENGTGQGLYIHEWTLLYQLAHFIVASP